MKRALTITQEAAFGTYNGAGTAINVRLSSNGAFSPMEAPEFWSVMDGSGLGVQVLSGTQTMGLAATLTTELTYTQASFLLGWAMTRINAGQTAPWTTTELPNDLGSCTIDYSRSYMDTGAFHSKRYLGCKVASLSLTASKDSPKVMARLGIIGGTVQGNAFDASSDPTITAPAISTYPTNVAVFQHLSTGLIKLNNVTRTNYDSFSLNINNRLKPYFDESRFANAIRLGGRSASAAIRLRKKSGTNDFTAFYAGTVQGATTNFKLDNGTNSITIDFSANSYFSALEEESPIDAEHYYTLTIMNQLYQTTPADFTFTYA